jgi:hypothetical protein
MILDDLLRWLIAFRSSTPSPGSAGIPTDDPILETALAARADLLVAGDRDLLSLKFFQGVGIISPADYLRVSFPAKS